MLPRGLSLEIGRLEPATVCFKLGDVITTGNKTTTGNITEGKRKPMEKELYFDWIKSDWTTVDINT